MTLYLKLTPNDPDATPLILVNGTTDTGYYVTEGESIGSPLLEVATGGGSAIHAVQTSANLKLRTYSLTVMVKGSSQSALNTRLRALYQAVEDVNLSGGGRLKAKAANLTHPVEFEVVSIAAPGDAWSKLAHTANAHPVPLQIVCRPYTLGTSSSISDAFTADTFQTTGAGYNLSGVDWTAVTGTFASSPITGGVVTASSALTTERLFTHTGTPNTYNHALVMVNGTVGTTLANFKLGVVIKYVDASNYLEAYIDDTGAASRLRIDVVVAGVRTNLVSTAATRLTVSTPISVIGWMENGHLKAAYKQTANVGISFAALDPAVNTETEAVMTSAQIAVLGDEIAGRTGMVWTPQQASATVQDWATHLAYRRYWKPSDTFTLRGLTGDANALGTLHYASSSGAAVQSAQAAWWKRPRPYNLVHNPGAESVITGWSGSAIASVNAASTVSRTTTFSELMEGLGAIKSVTTAAALNEGTNFKIWDTLKPGQIYTLEGYVKVIAGGITTIRYGAYCSGSVSSFTTATVNSSTWTRVSMTFIPSATTTGVPAYIGFTTNATVACTFALDRVQLYEGTTTPTYWAGGFVPCGNIHALNAVGQTGWTETNDATNYRQSYGLTVAGSLAAASALKFPLVTNPLNMDWGNDREAQFTVYGSFRLINTQVSPTVTVSVEPRNSTGAIRYTLEYGSTGKAIPVPSGGTCNRYVKLGTISLPVTRNNNSGYYLNLTCTNDPASVGVFGIDHIWLVPARSTAGTMTGVANDSTSTAFIGTTSSVTKSIAFDRTATAIRTMYETEGVPDNGFGGSDITLPTGDVDVLIFSSTTLLDQTGSAADSATKTHTIAAAIEAKPRYWGYQS